MVKTLVSAGILCAFLVACQTVPVSGRKAANIIPEPMEISMGEQSYQDVLSKERISSDPRLNELVTRVGQRIAAVSGRDDYKWEFKVIDSNVQNAFCLPGGKVAVYRGILPIAQNEAGLATVLGHEITHAIARHGGQRMTQGLGINFGLAAIEGIALRDNPNKGTIMGALGLGAQLGFALPYSRDQETEADEVGQVLMARAGYDPAESVRFWHRFVEVTKGKEPPALLSDHPATPAREEDMRNRLPKAQEEYAQAPNKYGLGDSF